MASDDRRPDDVALRGDTDLVIAIARGDRDALAELYDRYAPLMLALGRRILGPSREAEDVLHDVFVDVWKRAGDYDPARGRVRTWLLLRMRSRSIDRKRLAWNKRTEGLSERDEARPTASGGQPLAADGERIRAALADLPAEQAQVIALGYFDGMSASEIAERLELPIGTVKSRLASGLRKLRARLGPGDPEVSS